MKSLLQIVLVALMLTANAKAETTDSAHYFRAWQGFQKADLSSEQFLTGLSGFMKDTVDIYKGKALNNYIVILPPANKPAYIPDELALVALNSKENYDAIRMTPDGQSYSARHWDFFDKATSKSAPMTDYGSARPDSLITNNAYDMMGEAIDWANGYNAVFIGTKKENLTSKDFLTKLQSHIENAKAVMGPKGLKGYIVIANENYEIAYLNWESRAAHDAALVTEEGKAVFAEAGNIMNVLMYQQAVNFNAGDKVTPGSAYSNLQK